MPNRAPCSCEGIYTHYCVLPLILLGVYSPLGIFVAVAACNPFIMHANTHSGDVDTRRVSLLAFCEAHFYHHLVEGFASTQFAGCHFL